MASWKVEHQYPGKTPQEIYTATKNMIETVASKYGLKHDTNDQTLNGTVKRTGVDGAYHAAGEKLVLSLDFGFLIPGAIREKVQTEIEKRFEKLFG